MRRREEKAACRFIKGPAFCPMAYEPFPYGPASGLVPLPPGREGPAARPRQWTSAPGALPRDPLTP